VDDPWGLDDPPAEHAALPLPPRLATLATLTGQQAISEDDPLWVWPAAPELPEVQVLMVDGWYPLDAAPLHGLLPTVWPREHRCWLPDRLPRVAHRTDGTTSFLAPSRRHRHAVPDELVSEQAIEAGLPTPPAGRIWLLRSPFPAVPMRVLLRLIWLRSMQVWQEGRPAGLPTDMLAAGQELIGWSEDELLAWWTGPEAEAAKAWTALGRPAGDVAELVVRGLGPETLAPLLADGLTERQVAGWHDVVAGTGRPLVDTVRLWRGRGVGLDQAALLTRLVWVPEEEVVQWADAGFDYPAMVALAAVPLMLAVQWRDAGFSPALTVALLRADEVVSPAEVAAFGDLPRLVTWVDCGFGAEEAIAWSAVDITAQEARVWRSYGLSPSDVAQGVRLPPGYEVGGWVFPPGDPRDLVHPVDDPPGTRGRVARERREQAENQRFRPG
jgi:hypothetical protein